MALKKISLIGVLVILPVLFALLLPLFFSLNLFLDPGQFTSILAMIILPIGEGFLAISLSQPDKVLKSAYKFFIPWVPILLFFIVALVLKLQECACWMIGLPIFLLFSSLGGFIAGYFRKRYEVWIRLSAFSYQPSAFVLNVNDHFITIMLTIR